MQITKTTEPKTGNPIWYFGHTNKDKKIDFLDNIKKFINQNYYENSTLDVYDSISLKHIDIEVQPERITQVVDILIDKNQTFPDYIGVNKKTKCYVLAMPVTSKFTKHKHYRFVNSGLEYI